MLAPLGVFLAGVAWLGLSGAPDERGFWPILLAALGTGILLARDRRRYCDAAVHGMAQPLVLTMVLAWLLAGVLGALVQASGFVDTLAAIAMGSGVSGGVFAAAAFLVGALVSTSTGTSLGTLILTVPVLYPAGVGAGAHPAVLIGAILGGATFGDNISPVSDTTIASSSTQGADIGGVVRSRLRYAIPAALVALSGTLILDRLISDSSAAPAAPGAPVALAALVCGLGPIVALVMLLRRRHLVESLLAGAAVTLLLGLLLGTIAPSAVLTIDRESFLARGLLLDGMQRAVGISIFTLLLMGVVSGVEESGVVDRMIAALERPDESRSAKSARRTEWTIFGAVSGAVLLTTHSVVAILAVGRLADQLGSAAGVHRYRRANILDVTVCTYPFLLPFFIPTILAASLTAADAPGVPRVSPILAGLYNVHSWALLAVIVAAIATGWGRTTADST
ncbi:MAG: hypothetical protein HKN91_07120 [Acidimicrobiia bacterium]|nr:hypothetical protein [Acidimicrobiia bacterium]